MYTNLITLITDILDLPIYHPDTPPNIREKLIKYRDCFIYELGRKLADNTFGTKSAKNPEDRYCNFTWRYDLNKCIYGNLAEYYSVVLITLHDSNTQYDLLFDSDNQNNNIDGKFLNLGWDKDYTGQNKHTVITEDGFEINIFKWCKPLENNVYATSKNTHIVRLKTGTTNIDHVDEAINFIHAVMCDSSFNRLIITDFRTLNSYVLRIDHTAGVLAKYLYKNSELLLQIITGEYIIIPTMLIERIIRKPEAHSYKLSLDTFTELRVLIPQINPLINKSTK